MFRSFVVSFLIAAINTSPIEQAKNVENQSVDSEKIELPGEEITDADKNNLNASSSELPAEHKIDETYPSLDIDNTDSKDRDSFGNLIKESVLREEKEKMRKETKSDDRDEDRKSSENKSGNSADKSPISVDKSTDKSGEKSEMDKTGIPGLDEVMSMLDGVLRALRGTRGSKEEIKNPMGNGAGCVDCDSFNGMNPFTAIFDQINTLVNSLNRAMTSMRKITEGTTPNRRQV